MAKSRYRALKLIWSVPLNCYVHPGETIELDDGMAAIFLDRNVVEPAVVGKKPRIAKTRGRPAKESKRQRKQRESDNELEELLVEIQNEKEEGETENGSNNG